MMPRRSRHHRKRAWMWWVPLSALALLGLGAGGLTLGAKRYLKSDAFRELLSDHVASVLQVDGAFDTFRWTGSSVYSARFHGDGKGSLEEVDAQGIRAVVDFGSFRREAWEVEKVTVNRAMVNLAPTASDAPFRASERTPSPSFWSRWTPQKAEVSELLIEDLLVAVGDSLKGGGMRVRLSPTDTGWRFEGSGGMAKLGEEEPMTLVDMRGRFGAGRAYLEEATLEIFDHAKLRLSGDLGGKPRKLALRSQLDGLRGDRVFRPDWRQRLLGEMHVAMNTRGVLSEPLSWRHEGEIRLKDGVLMALPVLDKLADYARTERLRRLVLHEAHAQFRYEDEVLVLEDFTLKSDRLLQVLGKVHVSRPFDEMATRTLAGTFQVGVVRDVLKWLPGAEKRVFTEARSGYLWTTMRLGGTLSQPQEDLSPRLRQALVTGTVEAGANTALGVSRSVLGTASRLLGGPTGTAIDDLGNAVLDQADTVMEQGLEMVPLFGPRSR